MIPAGALVTVPLPVPVLITVRVTRVGDTVKVVGFFAVLDAEWSAAMAAWWSADPYAFLLQPTARRWGVVVAGGASVSPLRMLMGVGP